MNDERFCYVTTTGRRTGRPHTIEIWFVARDNTVYILMGGAERADTVRNVRANAAATVRVGDQTFAATARILDDPADPEAVYARTEIPKKYAADDTGLEEWADQALPIAFNLMRTT